MRQLAVWLLLVGCGRFGFGDDVVDAGGDTTVDFCAPTRVSPRPYADETSLSVVATPEGYVVFSVSRSGGPVLVQRFTPRLEVVDTQPLDLGVRSTRVAGGYGDRIVLAYQDEGASTSTLAVLTFGLSPVLTPKGTMIDPPGEDALHVEQGQLVTMAPDSGGYSLFQIPFDATSATAGGGAGTGDLSLDCAVDCEPDVCASICSKVTGQAICTAGRVTWNPGSSGGSFPSVACASPSLVHTGGFAYGAFDANPGIDVVYWNNVASGAGQITANVVPSGDHAKIHADDRGLVIAYRDANAVMTIGLAPQTLAVVRPAAPVEGMLAARGMALVPQGARTMLFVAAADGMYRACI
jgi:hypothetical protein